MLLVHHARVPLAGHHADSGPSHHELHACRPRHCAGGRLGSRRPRRESRRTVSDTHPKSRSLPATTPHKAPAQQQRAALPHKAQSSQPRVGYRPRKSALIGQPGGRLNWDCTGCLKWDCTAAWIAAARPLPDRMVSDLMSVYVEHNLEVFFRFSGIVHRDFPRAVASCRASPGSGRKRSYGVTST